MPPPLRVTFAGLCRDTRLLLEITQQALATTAGVTRGYIAMVESGRANPSLALVERIGVALGIEFQLVGRPPLRLDGGRPRDLVHARCSGYVDRRIRHAGWSTAREVEVVHGRSHGWIDLLAFDARTGTLLIVEIKTVIDDIGALERQIHWYERAALDLAHDLGWRPRRIMTWVLGLASEDVEAAIKANRDVFAAAFPTRAMDMGAILAGTQVTGHRGIALIDPTSRRRDWLMRSRSDGRRTPAPYLDYAAAARRLA